MEKREKKYGLLIAGALLLTVGIILAVITHNTSYRDSVKTGEKLKELTAQIDAVQEGDAEGDLDALNARSAELSDQKLHQERPYSYCLTLVFFALLLTGKGICNAVFGVPASRPRTVRQLAMAGLLAALCYIGFAFFKIDIPVGGYWGGLAGAVGMTIGDLTTSYVTSAPKTFLLKLLIGLIVGLVAHRLLKLSRSHSAKYVTGATIAASACGMVFNVIADPIVGYFYKTYLLGVPQDIASALAKLAAVTTAVNAVVAVIASTVFYLALRPALRKAGLFPEDV